MSICPKCDIPHHLECWRENNGCTTFSCDCKDVESEKGAKKITIGIDDLPVDEYGSRIYPSLSNHNNMSRDHGKELQFSSVLWQMALAGFVGGILIWIIVLVYFDFDYYANIARYQQVLIDIAVFSLILGGIVCAALSSIEGLTSKVPSIALKGIAFGLFIGGIGGFVGALFGQLFYNSFESMDIGNTYVLFVIRGIFWSFVGLFIGFGQGLGAGGGKRIYNGLLGGFIGGFVAGFLFDYFFLIFESAAFSGFLAITLFGVSVGVAIGTVQEVRKEAWLKVLEGATAGKEYIIHGEKTVIGSSHNCDIVLVKDNDVNPQHAMISQLNNYYIIDDLNSAKGVWLGGRRISKFHLKNFDIIRIGTYKMQFFEKQRA